MKKIILYTIIILLGFGCNSDEYSPNQVFNRKSPSNVNATQIALLNQKTASNTIRIAFSGDTQRSYAETALFVDEVNARNDIDFVILDGDISDFGLLAEFEGIYDIYKRLDVPFISVIGNHDLVANGRAVYERMFGALNFTFNFGPVKFVCHDTNGREYNFDKSTPNVGWLKSNLTLGNGITSLVAVSHVPPIDDDFDPDLRQPYQTLFNQTPGLIASLHSHRHAKLATYYQNGNTGVPFIVTNAIVKRAYTIIEITNGQINAQEINF
ncbi:metallophosphoesterase [Pedobacter polaris]|uniref:Metallophosphoesterase n=1 Tax=Pedobacter polaris TaxID=2571273 RepID=A0A4U1CIC6_9SPHI|nr:metallophosphoesterase [Pedobacter polaris]TKC06617.1 metallophosphoesterase [Pedobacter polaris]